MKILLAIDDSKFSEAAVKSLVEHFRSQGTEIRVLHVVEPVALSEPPQMAAGYYPELADLMPPARELAERVGRSLSAAGFKVTTSVAAGDARSLILENAAEWDADLIVLGSHGRKGLQRFFLGSVSEAVAHHAPCSVYIVRIPQ
jgi:nucleotide-binding universal stress UspA family protein